jgi:SAM-dependent methyltransferase
MWDERYSADEFIYGEEPNDFLRENLHRLPRGRTLCLAEGEGRNGVFLAAAGHDVLAVDQSAVGLAKAERLATSRGVKIRTQVADLATFDPGESEWDAVVSISAHLPSAIRRELHRRIVRALRPGGVFIIEAYTPAQHSTAGVGGPPPGHEDMLMSLAALREELAHLEELHGVELVREVNEGAFHSGPGAVVQFIARRTKGSV